MDHETQCGGDLNGQSTDRYMRVWEPAGYCTVSRNLKGANFHFGVSFCASTNSVLKMLGDERAPSSRLAGILNLVCWKPSFSRYLVANLTCH